jgi:signal transduction histidine kinase
MHSRVGVSFGALTRATDGPVEDVPARAHEESAHADGHDGSWVAVGGNDTAMHRSDGAVARSALATHSQASGLAATEISARTAIALGSLLADVRQILCRLLQTGDESVENERLGLITAGLAKVKRGDRLASELLAYSGCQRLVPEAVELRPLLCSLVDLLRSTLDRRIEVTVQVDDDCPPCRVDVRALKETLFNLAVNARDALSHGGRMHFTAGLATPANGAAAVALTLLDTGGGMAMETSQRAAMPFFTTKTNDTLAGLGLAAVEGFVRQSGGSMVLQTWMGTGTVVTLFLPRATREASRQS